MFPAVIVMSKVPLPGISKTRLMEKLSGAECAAFQMACLLDIGKMLRETGIKCYLYYTGGSPELFREKHLAELGFPGLGFTSEQLGLFEVRPQAEGDLGQRLDDACRQVLQNHDRLAVIGTDTPDITSDTILRVFKELDSCDIVLGPALDGGYYLLGLKEVHTVLFQDIRWGTGYVLFQTLEKARNAGLAVSLLEEKGDVDTWEDLLFFYHVGTAKKYRFANRLQSYLFAEKMIHKYAGTISELYKEKAKNENSMIHE
ncbi:TIGR04282 family arsenosugar biosynthesis glycosyltransferase [Zhaonella formicivorans]|jgi:hypothetical protein|uniref:TIGR04282 family arsenosugar biosynthesis glycosyltransferase n=1 Tax=Zhaonella formicivorans TaxID=2528593 RepID=UPI0010F27E04|nr:TIGR04282 family arsenosugar biosynthesis glycosyltransferase [Zhaonella formicivorans]